MTSQHTDQTSVLVVSVRPPVPAMLNDRMFDGTSYRHFGDATHWLRPYRALRDDGARRGVRFATEDRLPLGEAAVLLMMEMPQHPAVVAELRRAHPHLRIVLQLLESPLGRHWVFDPANHAMFDAVLTYNPALGGRPGYFLYNLPAGGVDEWVPRTTELPWEQRRTACQVSNVPNFRPLLPRRSGLGVIRAGWHFTPATWWNYITEGDSLYRDRLDIARALAETLPESFDIYGPGWDTLSIESLRHVIRGQWAGNKLDLLDKYRFNIAFENSLNDCGYVSEKLFDAFLAGTVPVYLGNTRIAEAVPAAAFVDAREFRSPAALARRLATLPRAEWVSMRDAGAAFLGGQARSLFGSGQYVEAVLAALRYAAPV